MTPGPDVPRPVAVFSLLVQPMSPLITAAGQQAQPATAAAPPQATTAKPAPGSKPPLAAVAAATPAPIIDGGWPRAYTLPSGGNILVYQPQIASWDKQTHMTAFSAVSHRAKSGDKPALGTIKLEATTRVALEDRLVNFQGLKIVESNFPTLPKESLREVVAEIEKAIPDDERVIALDRVLGHDKAISFEECPGIAEPRRSSSADTRVIVNLDGEAIWSPIKENDLKFMIANWDLFQHVPTNTTTFANIF
jgi:hypothetical protein